MLVNLDSVICIYAVEGAPSFQARARARLATMRLAGDQPAISDLTWLECRVKPIRLGDAAALADLEAFLTSSDLGGIFDQFRRGAGAVVDGGL